MGILAGGVAEQIDDYQQIQFFQCFPPARFATHAEQWIAGNHHQRANRVVVIENQVRQQIAGQGATDMA